MSSPRGDGWEPHRLSPYRVRRMFLVRCDCRNTHWFRAGRPPPGSAAPEGLSFSALAAGDWPAQAKRIMCEPALAQRRFREGGRCVILADAAGTTLYEIWVLVAPTWIDWVKSDVAVPEGYCLFAGAWTHPGHRNRGLHEIGIARAIEEGCRMGRPGIFAGIEAREVLQRASRHVAAGKYEYEVDYVLERHELLGLRWLRRRPPPPDMAAALARLRREHAARFAA